MSISLISQALPAPWRGVQGPVEQGIFLTSLGLFQRTERLMRNRAPEQAAALMAAARRLAEPQAMGRLFKVMTVCSWDWPPLPGLPLPGLPLPDLARPG